MINTCDWRLAAEVMRSYGESQAGLVGFKAKCPNARHAWPDISVNGQAIIDWKPGQESVDIEAEALELFAVAFEELAQGCRAIAVARKQGKG